MPCARTSRRRCRRMAALAVVLAAVVAAWGPLKLAHDVLFALDVCLADRSSTP